MNEDLNVCLNDFFEAGVEEGVGFIDYEVLYLTKEERSLLSMSFDAIGSTDEYIDPFV